MKDLQRFVLKSRTSTKSSTQEWWTFKNPWGKIEVVVRNWKTGHPIIQGNRYFIDYLRKEKIISFEDTNAITDNDIKKFYEDSNSAQTFKKYSKPIDIYSL